MVLMVNGKKVLGYALGGNEFYSLDNSLDNLRVSVSLECSYRSESSLRVPLDPRLSPDSTLTLGDLRDKGEKIRLIVSFHKDNWDPVSSLNSGTIDFSKPDSKGHFNFKFQGVNNFPVIDAYCFFSPSDNKFEVYSDAFNAYSGSDYDPGNIQVLYSDWS